jgi:hypothetical protein
MIFLQLFPKIPFCMNCAKKKAQAQAQKKAQAFFCAFLIVDHKYKRAEIWSQDRL